jgi:hypothetical protein
MTAIIRPYQSQEPWNHQEIKEEALRAIGFVPSDQWGHLWVSRDELYILVPWEEPEDLSETAVLFLDESFDAGSRTLLYGGLAFLPLPLIIATARFIADILVVCSLYPGVWPGDTCPPRLHLRELYPFAARQKTAWRHMAKNDLNLLIRAALSNVVHNSAFRCVFPVNQKDLKRSFELAASDLTITPNILDLSIQAAAIQLRIASVHNLGSTIPVRLVMDHDATPIRLGKGRRQKTWRFLDAFEACGDDTLAKHGLILDRTEKASSQFPKGFCLETLRTKGYPVQDLLNPVGLQFADLFLGLWRQLSINGKSPFAVTLAELGNPIIQEIKWLKKLPAEFG